MTEKHFITLMAYFDTHPHQRHILCRLCSVLPGTVMVLYPLLLLALLMLKEAMPWPEILAPALTLASTVVLRRVLPQPRPFEVFHCKPLIDHSCGGSFPSRHSASALAIALAGFTLHPVLGIMLTVLSLLIGASRILAGLHFPRDVLSGYGLALLLSIPFQFFL